MPDKVLQRTMFETSRVLEYFTERELSYQTGHNKSDWPLVILKELMDNALDACENASIPPQIKVELQGKKRKCIRCGFVAPVEWFELGLNKRKNKQGICPGCQADDNQERRHRRMRRKALELPEHAYCDRHMAELLKNSSN